MTSRTRRLQATAGAVAIVAVVALIAGGFFLLGRTASPAQRLADAAVLPAPPVAAKVEMRALAEMLHLEGSVTPTSVIAVPVPPLSAGVVPVVTTQSPEAGQALQLPQVVGGVAGSPVVAFHSQIPLYRARRIGDSGPDILALKGALTAYGGSPGTSDTLDARTETALVNLWKQLDLDASVDLYDEATTESVAVSPEASSTSAGEPRLLLKPSLFVFLPAGSLVVAQGSRPLGSVLNVDEPLMTVNAGQIQVTVAAQGAQIGVLKVGDPAAGSVGGTAFSGSVTSIGAVEQNGQSAVVIVPDEALEPALNGQAASVSVTIQASDGPVLCVPVEAVRDDRGGSQYALLAGVEGPIVKVPLEVSGIIDGYAVISAGGRLAEGDEVVVGG